MPLELRYLALEWDKKKNLVSFSKDHYPIEVLQDDVNTEHYFAETIAFNRNDAKFVGLKLEKYLKKSTPYIDANGKRIELTAIKDPATGEMWWVELAKWLKDKNSYGSELYWAVGELTIHVEHCTLTIENSETTLSKEELDYCLKDFKNELWRIIMRADSPITGQVTREVPNIFESEIFKYAQQFISAADDILKEPKYILKETQKKMERSRVRPIARTFREIATRPDSRFLTSRVHQLSYDTPENRYIHYCADRLLTIFKSAVRILESYRSKFEDEISAQDIYIDNLSNNNVKRIDKDIFLNELKDLQERSDQLDLCIQELDSYCSNNNGTTPASSGTRYIFENSSIEQGHTTEILEMTFGSRFGSSGFCFFVNSFQGQSVKENYNLQYILCDFSTHALSQLRDKGLDSKLSYKNARIQGVCRWTGEQINARGNKFNKVTWLSLTGLEITAEGQNRLDKYNLILDLGETYGTGNSAAFFATIDDSHPAENIKPSYTIIEFAENNIYQSIVDAKEIDNTASLKLKIKFFGSCLPDKNRAGRSFCRIACKRLIQVELLDSGLKGYIRNKNRKLQLYEQNSWTATFSRKEQNERKQELAIARSKREAFVNALDDTSQDAPRLVAICSDLARIKTRLSDLKIKPNSFFPNSMTFVQNPAYSSAHSAFRSVLKISGIDIAQLEALLVVDKIQVSNISAVYERWCLLQIIGLIIDTYKFDPTNDWKSRLIAACVSNEPVYNLDFHFEHSAVFKKITLSYEKELPNKKRPDFILSLDLPQYYIEDKEWRYRQNHQLKLVMDAKFKGKVSHKYIKSMLMELYNPESKVDNLGRKGKNYSEDFENKVFVLHATPKAIPRVDRVSPLSWGKFCDYGQKYDANHNYGHIYLAPSLTHLHSNKNLQRLVGLFLQSSSQILSHIYEKGTVTAYCTSIKLKNSLGYRGTSFIYPEQPLYNNRGKSNSSPPLSFYYSDFQCISCGDLYQDAVWKPTKQGDKWEMNCHVCRSILIKTFCYGCGTELYKNDHTWTYHETISDQIGHVVCPFCGSYFESEPEQ